MGENSPARKNPSGSLLPAVHDLRTVAVEIATAVGLEAQRAGLASKTSAEELRPELRPASGRRSIRSLRSAGEMKRNHGVLHRRRARRPRSRSLTRAAIGLDDGKRILVAE